MRGYIIKGDINPEHEKELNDVIGKIEQLTTEPIIEIESPLPASKEQLINTIKMLEKEKDIIEKGAEDRVKKISVVALIMIDIVALIYAIKDLYA